MTASPGPLQRLVRRVPLLLLILFVVTDLGGKGQEYHDCACRDENFHDQLRARVQQIALDCARSTTPQEMISRLSRDTSVAPNTCAQRPKKLATNLRTQIW